MSDVFHRDFGETIMSDQDKLSLTVKGISKKSELDALEQQGVTNATMWLATRRRKFDILETENLLALHKKMFHNIWKWAGEFRTGPVNIGNVQFNQIRIELEKLHKDYLTWVTHQTYPFETICIMVHHRLVLIHPFPNGNGRHSRLVCDHLANTHGVPAFTWGQTIIAKKGFDEAKRDYLNALANADNRQLYDDLLKFATS